MARPIEFDRPSVPPDVDVLADNLKEFLKQVEDCPLLDGRQIDGLEITSGTALAIDHKLNRTPEGWIVVRISDNAAAVYETTAPTSEVLTLDASANCTLSIWVY